LRKLITYKVNDNLKFKENLLRWAQQFCEIIWLDSNSYSHLYGDYELILAAEAFTLINTDHVDAFEKLDEYQKTTKDWLFGYLTYDLKNDTENLVSQNHDGLCFPDLFFFQPQRIITLKDNQVTFHYLNMIDDEIESDFLNIINNEFTSKSCFQTENDSKVQVRLTQKQYLERIALMQNHILRGDIYEANYCQEFFLENISLHPVQTFSKLNSISKAPFASFFRNDDLYAMCSSPERFVKKIGNKVVSQPIKGTSKRSDDDKIDNSLAKKLKSDPKERAENVMIVDLVRNDLSRIAQKSSVKVEELCKVYPFKQVHQMISTVSCLVKPEVSPVEVIKNCFPMGSMTGAPKISAMEIIEKLEVFKRGLYSGSIGYFNPNGDFDFNVVIRSILYNESQKYASFSVGSAITAKSDPEKEYEECLLKAKAMRQVLLS